ncbi:MAG: hypothetical protein HY328_15150 [Chloroflexi bacterium]|nr:hypothetical protein [Chloroflexota bacterium]
MSTQTESQLDFGKLMDRMETARQEVVEERPAIVGGRFTHSQLDAFLAARRVQWDQMPWRIWEHVSAIDFADEPASPDLLQRADIFGPSGHLSLRRDGDRWLWHFIGAVQPNVPPEFNPSDFWKRHSDTMLRRYEESVILWGQEVRIDKDDPKTGIGLWQDDRVGAARLAYPQMSGNLRVYLHYWRYTEAGQTAFVWYRGLGDEQGVKSWPK